MAGVKASPILKLFFVLQFIQYPPIPLLALPPPPLHFTTGLKN